MASNWMVVMMGVLTGAALADAAEPPAVRYLFQNDADGLRFAADGWSIAAPGDDGWRSLRVGGDEFLHRIAFEKDGRLVTLFPDRSNITHDRSVGRVGSVSDGVYLVRVTPDATGAGFELYAGHNDAAEHRLVLLLSEGVVAVRRTAGPERAAGAAVLIGKPGQGGQANGATIVHRSGRAVVISDKCWVGTLADEAGTPRLAVALTTKGFEANAFRVALDAAPRRDGLVTGPTFRVKSPDDPTERTLGATAGVLNPVYGPDTRLDFGVEFGVLAGEAFTGTVELEVVHALGQRHFFQRRELTGAKPDDTGVIRVPFEPRFTMPGVSEVWGRIIDDAGRLVWVDRYRMAYDIEGYRPQLVVPEDFEAFWRQTLEELRATPLEPQTRRVPQFEDHPTHELYEVTWNGWRGARTHAMLYVPRAGARPLPAIVTAHPGARGWAVNKGADGVYGSKLKFDPRFVVIQPLIRGHAPDAPDIPFNHPWWGPLDSRDDYVARAWYCAMVRAVDYLATRGDLVDMKRIVAQGGSQGGALALVTAALDPRVAYCVADCPANGQPQEIMRHYASFGPSRGQVPPGRTEQEVVDLLSYYNPVNFAALIRCPTYVGSNIGDLTVHSMGPLAAYANLRQLRAEDKAFYPGFTHFHGSGPGLGVRTRAVLDELAGGVSP